ncbi:MFS transporter [Amycolatopsis nivea]|uniref:MFS transporter n=1 Tax=Amycolatopsis nivea TaxID=1644109 RepID=UPI001070508C|nr:MFS transporter [Amycolatopsis nivea]
MTETRRAWLGLLVVLGPVLLVSMDGSILFLAMPTITHALAPTPDQALWILDSYGFAVGSLLIAFGSLGDRYGRLKLLMIGAAVFGAGSAGAAFATGPEWLIGCRVLMGLGGATLLPSGLAVLSEVFPEPRRRARAIGIFAATFAAGFAIGPILGGVLLSRFGWGSVFLVNLPVVAVFLAAAPVVLREVKTTRPGKVDLLSIVLSAGGLLLTVYAVKNFAAYGLSWSAIAGVLGAAVLTWFLRRQRKLEYPLLDVTLFREKVFTVAVITGVLSLFAWSAAAFLTGMYLQSVLGVSVLAAALLALPGAAALTAVCVLTPAFSLKIGNRAALVTCHFAMALGLALLLATTATGGIGWFIASSVVAGVGYGISFSLVADTAVGAVPADRAGSAGAIAETSNEIGNALGIAVLGSVAAFVVRSEGTAEAHVTGLHVAMGIAAVLCAGLGVLALRWLPKDSSAEDVVSESDRVVDRA